MGTPATANGFCMHSCNKATLLLAIAGSALLAQTPGSPPRALTDSVRESRPLFMRSDLKVLGFFAAGTVLMFPLDRHLASVIRDEDLVTNKTLHDLASGFRFFGGPGPYLIGSSLYVVGRVSRVRRAAELGLHGTEAVVVGQGVSSLLKVILGRARPYTSLDTNPSNFAFMRGLKSTDFESFPSGHSTSAFAAAAAVSAETSEWWPETRWILGPILYGGAAMVGLSRMYDDKHWASDVVMGAAIGTFAGLKTVRFNHTHDGNRLDRWLLGTTHEPPKLRIAPSGDGGVQLGAVVVW
jgi:membrane-associated phospholipid phosphatase